MLLTSATSVSTNQESFTDNDQAKQHEKSKLASFFLYSSGQAGGQQDEDMAKTYENRSS